MKEVKAGLLVFLFFVALLAFLLFDVTSAVPTGPDEVTIESNTTKGGNSAYNLNVSGGRVVVFNVSSTIQNDRWKAMIGRVSGSFTLDDAGGSTVYDWSLSSIGGEVYATSNSSTINWNNLTCASTVDLEGENNRLGHSNPNDNLTATFDDDTHEEFFVASRNITVDTCPTLNTYVGNATQNYAFEEVVLYEFMGGNIVFATILEDSINGYNNKTYDFQMVVPEVGTEGFDSSTAYYLYVEIS